MSSLITEATIQIRKDTAGNWTSNNPTPASGEWCKEIDTGYLKNGDGSTAWTSLDYQPNPAEVDGKVTGSADQLCKAWVNFDGTTNTAGKCTIRDSFNVTDVDDNGTGDYTINFTNALANANYVVSGSAGGTSVSTIFNTNDVATARTTSLVRIIVVQPGVANADDTVVNVIVFGS